MHIQCFSLQKQVSVMSMNLSAKLDELQRGDRHLETTVALCEIRTQLQELTKSVESCQSEVSEVRTSVSQSSISDGFFTNHFSKQFAGQT